jgi:protein polybromo-1
MDKGRYKRLDRFQDDVFALFNRVRLLSRPESQLFLDSIDLQKFFISKREELCKGVLVSPASSFTESDLWDEIEARKKAFKREKSPIASDKEVDSEKPMEVDEAEKPKVPLLP